MKCHLRIYTMKWTDNTMLCLSSLADLHVMCFAIEAMSIHFTDGKCHMKKLRSIKTCLTSYWRLTYFSCWPILLFIIHTYLHTPTHNAHTRTHARTCTHTHTHTHYCVVQKFDGAKFWRMNQSVILMSKILMNVAVVLNLSAHYYYCMDLGAINAIALITQVYTWKQDTGNLR